MDTSTPMKGQPLTTEQQISGQWRWFLFVLLGGIGTLAIRRLDEGFWAAWSVSFPQAAHYVFLATCLLAFLIYDVGVLLVLTEKFPYKISLPSILRYALDIAMSVMIFNLMMSGLGPPPVAHAPAGLARVPSQSPLLIVIAISVWHGCAALWHFLAGVDYGHGSPKPGAFFPHLFFGGVYWLIYAAASLGWLSLSDTALLSVIGGTLFLISIIRWYQVIRHAGEWTRA